MVKNKIIIVNLKQIILLRRKLKNNNQNKKWWAGAVTFISNFVNPPEPLANELEKINF